MSQTSCKGCGKAFGAGDLDSGRCAKCAGASGDSTSKSGTSAEGSAGEPGGGGAGEAVVARDDLIKAMDRIEELAKSETPESRKQDLLRKAVDGKITEEERGELAALLKGEQASFGPAEELGKSLSPNDDDAGALAKSIDVSDALAELVGRLEKALGDVGEHIEKSTAHQGEVNLVLAKGLLDSCKLALATHDQVKGLREEIGQYLSQPAHGRRSAASRSACASIVNKSHAGGAAAGEDQISKGEVLELLDAMVQDQISKGKDPAAPCGEDLIQAIAKVEAVGDVSPALMRDLAKFRASRAN